MPTKDPHIAVIDAQEKLHEIKLKVKEAVALFKSKASKGQLTKDDLVTINAIKQLASDATWAIQDELAEELESHERHGHPN